MARLPRSDHGKTIAEMEAEGFRWVRYDKPREVQVQGTDGAWYTGWLDHWKRDPDGNWKGWATSPTTPGFGTTYQWVPADRLRPAERSQ